MIRDELVRMLTGPHRARALDLMEAAGALAVILPEVADMRGVAQPPQYHPEGDVWTHTKAALDALENPSPVLAMATLLHDVGKPVTYEEAPDRIRFHNHDDVGAEIAEQVCRRLRFSNEEIDAIVAIVRRHMAFLNLQKMRPAKVARFLASPTIDDEIEMHRADCIASHGGLENYEFARSKLEEARAEHPEILPPPLLTGDDLIGMGYKPGPVFSKILDAVQEQQLEGGLGSSKAAKKWVMEQFPAK